MRDHTLLQAIARVNRPYEDDSGEKKPSGLVVDFIGIFENIQKALAFDSDIVASVIKNIDVLKDLFIELFLDGVEKRNNKSHKGWFLDFIRLNIIAYRPV